MTSFVADLLVNPVIRQARRFSFSSLTSSVNTTAPGSPLRTAQARRYNHPEDIISETEENFYLGDDAEGSASSSPSSRSSVQPHPATDVADLREGHSQSDSALIPAAHNPFELPLRSVDSRRVGTQNEPMPPNDSNMDATDRPTDVDPSLRSDTYGRLVLPEDDGMGTLRKRILVVQAQDIDASEKARLMHQLLIEGYKRSQVTVQRERPFTPSSSGTSEQRSPQVQRPLDSFKFWQNSLAEAELAEAFNLTDADLEPTFAPKVSSTASTGDLEDPEYPDYRPLGCEHYRRNVKMQCSTCHRWYTCRFCHDKVEDHTLVRHETNNMLCMFCGTAQRAGEACLACGASASRYYCSICKLWNDDPDKPCYHCNDCGICRIGRGLGKDFFHCKKCCACIAISVESDHRCIERSTDCDCPICGEYMFNSPHAVCFMKCGHSIHRQCFQEHMRSSYKCPICNKSLTNMEIQFRNLDIAIQAQPMPSEFRDTRAIVLCNDCSAKSQTLYHWLGLKCSICLSYNTVQLQIIGLATETMEGDIGERNAQVSGLTTLGNPDVAAVRDVRRRRHSSNVMNSSAIEPNLDSRIPERYRLARSVSPLPIPGPSLNGSVVGASGMENWEDEENQDILSLWSRVPRSIGSGEDEEDESDDNESSDEEVEEEEADESDDDDDFGLLGHR